ncbi:MAG: AAA family ATPase, partial [Prevotella sp.]
TALVYQLVRNMGVYFLSRPRRFGKSLLVSTIKYYFQGRKDLFRGLKMEQFEHDWEQYPVFEIDFNGKDYTDPRALEMTLEGSVGTWEGEYGKSSSYTALGDRFAYVLKQAHEKTGKRCVVLIDEYDKPMLDVMDSGLRTSVDGVEMTLEEKNRNTLKAFYSVFKAADADLRFVFLTGVTKFAQVSVFSGFNNAQDISMVPRFDAICGITEDELSTVFHQSIEELAKANGETFEETAHLLKATYDGYHFSKAMVDIYNPFSLFNAFKFSDVRDYWFATGTPTYLIRLLNHNNENIQEIINDTYQPQEFVDYRATAEAPVPMIYQSGYLTIKGYDRDFNEYKLDFPNKEVSTGFLTMLAASYFNAPKPSGNLAARLAKALRTGNTDQFHDLLSDFVASIPYSVRKDNSEKSHEKQFQLTVYLIMRLVGSCNYTVYHEKESSQGRADCVIETPKFIYIFEYKLDHPAADAIQQIEDKGYAEPYAHDARRVYRIGCSFSSETGRVSDWAVR